MAAARCVLPLLILVGRPTAFATSGTPAGVSQGDVTALVQGRLHPSVAQGEPGAPSTANGWVKGRVHERVHERVAALTLAKVSEQEQAANLNSTNNSTPTPEPTPAPTPYPTLYRITFTRTWGADHVCLTEIEFYDDQNIQLHATLESASSCWGCAVDCNACTADFGNPLVQFDNEVDSESPSAYFCSGVGSFLLDGGESKFGFGESSVQFHLPKRPRRYVLRRPEVKGDAIARDWIVEEQMSNRKDWRVISAVTDREPNVDMEGRVQDVSGPAGRWWEYEVPKCLLDFPKTPDLKTGSLIYNYTPRKNLFISNTGYGIAIDGEFGNLNIPDDPKTYEAKQVHFRFPSQRVANLGEDRAVGEMLIVHQMQDLTEKQTIRHTQNGILIVAVPLMLPSEEMVASPTKSESWFLKLGFNNALPGEGEPREIGKTVDLNAFNDALNGTYTEVPCQGAEDHVEAPMEELLKPKPRWLLLDKPAFVTGDVLQAFKKAYPYDNVGYFGPDGVFYSPVEDQGNTGNTEWTLGRLDRPEAQAGRVMVNLPEGAKWVINPEWQAGCGDWETMGVWDIPAPDAPAPAAAPVAAEEPPLASS